MTSTTMSFDDADALAEAGRGWDQEYAQLTPGAFQAVLSVLEIPGLVVSHETMSQSVRIHSGIDRNSFAFGLFRQGDDRSRWFGRPVSSHEVGVLHSNQEILCRSPRMGDIVHVVIDSGLMSTTCERLANRDLIAETLGTSTFQAEPARVDAIGKHLVMLVETATKEPRIFASEKIHRAVRSEVVRQFLATIPDRSGDRHRPRASLARRRKIVTAVEESLRENLGEAVTITDLCKIAHASERTISYAFQSFWDMSPAAYLKSVRLNHVHKDLRRADAAECSVQAVASDWGFWHMGHFARDYKSLFRELPSETLARPAFR